eukprot:356139-Chlamydomonas_euryale.AAC.7
MHFMIKKIPGGLGAWLGAADGAGPHLNIVKGPLAEQLDLGGDHLHVGQMGASNSSRHPGIEERAATEVGHGRRRLLAELMWLHTSNSPHPHRGCRGPGGCLKQVRGAARPITRTTPRLIPPIRHTTSAAARRRPRHAPPPSHMGFLRPAAVTAGGRATPSAARPPAPALRPYPPQQKGATCPSHATHTRHAPAPGAPLPASPAAGLPGATARAAAVPAWAAAAAACCVLMAPAGSAMAAGRKEPPPDLTDPARCELSAFDKASERPSTSCIPLEQSAPPVPKP